MALLLPSATQRTLPSPVSCCSRCFFSIPSRSPAPFRRVLKLRRAHKIVALVVDPSDSAQGNVDDFVARMEKTWLISKQPRPVICVSCKAEGTTECPWCKGTGFFILGDNMLCEVPSKNTKCLICLGQGSVRCKDCKGTGHIAKWLCNPSSNKKVI